MNYVISDIHGDYGSYRKMLDIIGFDDTDTLYIVGDICDRGLYSAELYLDIMARKNVISIKGNHEFMAEKVLPYLFGFEKIKSRKYYNGDYEIWLDNGGKKTIESLSRLDDADKKRILDYIDQMPFYVTVKTDSREFLLVHAGLHGYEPQKSLDSYLPHDLVWMRPSDFNAKLWEDPNKYLVVGHTPTSFINPDRSLRIFHGKGNIIAIDCGNAYRAAGGKLACICLDTMEEFYV